MNGEADPGFAVKDRGAHWGRAPIARQERRMNVERAVWSQLEGGTAQDLAIGNDDQEIGSGLAERREVGLVA